MMNWDGFLGWEDGGEVSFFLFVLRSSVFFFPYFFFSIKHPDDEEEEIGLMVWGKGREGRVGDYFDGNLIWH